MIDPFNEVPECFDESLVLHNYSDDKSLCYLDHEKLRAARAYFSVGCLNAAYIVLTTAIFVYFAGRTTASKSQLTNKSNIQSEDWQRVLYDWRRSSLRKRSIFGTLVGAIGHLLLSTSLLLAQAFYTFISCEIYTWGVILGIFTWLYAYCWRAFRLYYLLRLNKLKTQFANWMQNQTLNRGAQQDHVDYEEFMRYKEGYFYRVSYAAYAIILIVFAIVCVFTEVFALRRRHPECKAKWGVLIIAAVLGAFFLVITPITIWQLRRTKDLHGIRTELMIDVAVGLPCYILMLVWFGFYGRLIPAETGSYYKFFFSPANWSIVFTSAAHVTSVVFPLIQVLYRNRRGKNAKAKIAAIPHRQQGSDSHDDDDDGFDDTMNRISTRVDSKPCPCMHLQSPRTLQQLLSNPKTLKELLQLSIQDFSSENVLFYEAYLKLVDKVKRRDADFHPIFWFPWLRSSTTLIIPDIDQSPEQVSLFTEPIRDENLLADFSEFYCTYIRESAPLQVNISCKARCELDLYFRSLKLSTLASKLSRLTETSHRWSSVHSSNSASAVAGGQGPKGTPPSLTAEDGSRRTSISSTNRSASAVVEICNPPLTLAMFEPARKEVFWNIFASVYLKYIAKENKFNTRCAQCCGR